MQTTWSWTDRVSNDGARFTQTHPLTSKPQTASSRGARSVAGGFAATRVNSHSVTTSNSLSVQTLEVTTPTFPVSDNWTAAREAFLTRHGPRAIFPRRPRLSKELRKALLATEMAAWEAP